MLRVPLSALTTGQALTLKQAEVIGLYLGETWNEERVKTVLGSLFERCGWSSQVVSDCGSDIKKGIVETLLEAPNGASWFSDDYFSHLVVFDPVANLFVLGYWMEATPALARKSV